jgi:hypothetical protein
MSCILIDCILDLGTIDRHHVYRSGGLVRSSAVPIRRRIQQFDRIITSSTSTIAMMIRMYVDTPCDPEELHMCEIRLSRYLCILSHSVLMIAFPACP